MPLRQSSVFYPGAQFQITHGECAEVVSYLDKNNVTVRVGGGQHFTTTGRQLRSGAVKNPFRPSVFGVGFVGVGPHATKLNGKDTKAYYTWVNMLRRCYTAGKGIAVTYADANVCDGWHCFQAFAGWFNSMPQAAVDGIAIDKDILVPGNRTYSSTTCSLVPQEINAFLTLRGNDRGPWPLGVHKQITGGNFCAKLSVDGKQVYLGFRSSPEAAFYDLYKPAKEAHARALAEKWKEVISAEVYSALCRYVVRITD